MHTKMGEVRVEMKIRDEFALEDLYSMIHQIIGRASMCWEFPEKAGIFDTEQACRAGDELYEFISNMFGIGKFDRDE